MNILVVDDSKAMRRIVIRTVKKAGFDSHEYFEAENGRDALERIPECSPDLILCDWNMPEMNGIEFLRELRGSGNDVAFGFITTEGTPEMRQQANDAGANFLLQKPFTELQVEQTLTPFVPA